MEPDSCAVPLYRREAYAGWLVDGPSKLIANVSREAMHAPRLCGHSALACIALHALHPKAATLRA
jgi:hypothetical protein